MINPKPNTRPKKLNPIHERYYTLALQTHGFSVPQAVEHNRHCVIMSLVQGYPYLRPLKRSRADLE
ncbi:RIO kinase family protein, putative [Medicago truncatula]|uniref:non-specific serine/threonine protein kinase n=1 Tax=Medicago truncatula TaxID=3880 RepID=G7JNQ4_MEDTR|nr:RIO kinase family protein, putative [Medicago truncatula]